MVRRLLASAVLGLVVLTLPACMTMLALGESKRGSRMFGGTQMHFRLIGSPNYSKPMVHPAAMGWGPLDFPLSLAADIVLLPYTVPAQLIAGNLELKHPKVHYLIACASEDMPLARHLIEQHPKLPRERDGGHLWKPSFLAVVAATGQPEFVALLLEHGADPSAVDEAGKSALHYAVDPTRIDLSPPLYGGEMAALERRARRVEVVRLLVARGGKLTERVHGATLLHAAARCGDVSVIRFLVEQGADVNAISNAKATPLHFAVWAARVEAVRFLLEHGADVGTRDASGRTSLQIAREVLEHAQRFSPGDRIKIERRRKLVELIAARGRKEQGVAPAACSFDTEPYLDT